MNVKQMKVEEVMNKDRMSLYLCVLNKTKLNKFVCVCDECVMDVQS